MDTIARIAKVLDCTIAYLVGDVDDPHQVLGIADDRALDVQLVRIKEVVEAGVFKRDTYLKSYPKAPVYPHPRATEHQLEVYLMGDNSMAGLGILRGDIITVAQPYADRLTPLEDGRIVLCVRQIIPPGITEVSIRQVAKADNQITLRTVPLDGERDEVGISDRERPPLFPENLFFGTDGNGLIIEGEVIRVTRDL